MSIRSKLTIALIVFTVIPLSLVSFLTFEHYKSSLEAIRLSELQHIVAFKADKIETYFASLNTQADLAQNFYNIRTNMPVIIRLVRESPGEEYLVARKTLDEQLQQMQTALGLSDIMLADPSGIIVYSSNPSHTARDLLKPVFGTQPETYEAWRRGIKHTDVFSSEKKGGKPVMLISTPITDTSGNFIGFVVFEVDMNPFYLMIDDRTGLGATGETLAGQRRGDRIVYLTPLRQDSKAALTRSVDIGGALGGPIQHAVKGESGAGLSIDYRGQRVIAAWKYIPSLGWGVVAKIDTDEAFSDVRHLRIFAFWMVLLILGVGGTTAFFLARSISDPIRKLSKGADIIGKGNLDYKVGTGARDEIGQLSRAFDKMTAEQKRAQERLRANSQYARSLIEASLDPLVTISSDGKITDVNDATIKATGKAREELIGTDFSGYFTEPEKARAGYRQVFAKGFVTDYPLTIRHRDGKLTEVLYNASIYKDTHGDIAGIFAAARDVTELRKAEAELRRHRDSLEELVKERTAELEEANLDLLRSNENLEQFAYVASHDLQEPLRVMSSYSQLLEKRYHDKLGPDAKDFIGFIVDAAKRMQRLITDLLAYSRVGRKDLAPAEVDFNEAINKVIYGMKATIEESGGQVTHDPLPVLWAHETSVMQIFQNLISNALKFRGKEAPRIHISAKRDDVAWVFSVADNGLGIEPQYHDRIFQIFQRLHSREEYSGTGIGLSICKKIVTNYGGKMWVESGIGKGSTFYFSIPI